MIIPNSVWSAPIPATADIYLSISLHAQILMVEAGYKTRRKQANK